MIRILVVDDDLHLRKLVKTYAELEQMICEEADCGATALKKSQEQIYDLVILDVMMPGLDGFQTMAKLREFTDVPVIFLTSRKEEYDRLLGFNLGADDYVPKPFSPKELIARIHAVLNRTRKEMPAATLYFGALEITENSRLVTIASKNIHLKPKEFDLLIFFARHNRIVFTREQLLEKVWGYEYSGDVRTVDTHVRALRDRLGTCKHLIQTVWGVGYKFEYTEKTTN